MTLSPAEAIVLAGGAGTRLRSVLADVPKVLAPIGGRPFLHLLLSRLVAQGVESVVIATGYAADEVESAAGSFGGPLAITFSREIEPLGTGGAIGQAFDRVRGPRAWVFNGDSYCDVDLGRVAGAAAAAPEEPWVVAVEVPDAARFGTLEMDASAITEFREKTGRSERGWINAGIYLLPRDLVRKGPSSIERDLFPLWAAQGRLRVFAAHGRFIDIGTPESLREAEPFFA